METTKMNAEEFRPIMAYLQICSDREFDDHALNVWFDALKDLSADAVQTAAKRFALEDGERLTVAKIRRLATEAVHGMLPGHGAAFEVVMKAVRCFGSYDSERAMATMPPIVRMAVLQCGGFGVFCDSPPNERNTLRAQFRMAFEDIARREELFRALPEHIRPRLATEFHSATLTLVPLQLAGRSGSGPRTLADSLSGLSGIHSTTMKGAN